MLKAIHVGICAMQSNGFISAAFTQLTDKDWFLIRPGTKVRRLLNHSAYRVHCTQTFTLHSEE